MIDGLRLLAAIRLKKRDKSSRRVREVVGWTCIGHIPTPQLPAYGGGTPPPEKYYIFYFFSGLFGALGLLRGVKVAYSDPNERIMTSWGAQ